MPVGEAVLQLLLTQVLAVLCHHGKNEQQAGLIATVFRNCYFLGCGYHEDVMAESQKYWEPQQIEHYVKLSQS